MTDKTADFTQGSILKKLVAFMMPVLGSLILQAAYGAVDLLVVGRFGSTSGLSAVSTGSQILNLVTFVVVQFAMGITVLIARYLGEKKPEQIGSVIGGAAIVFTAISVGLFIVMVCFAHPIAILMQAPAEAVQFPLRYAATVTPCGNATTVDCCLHPYLWRWNLLYRRLQPAFRNFPWTRRQQVSSAFCTCRMHHKCFR